MTHLEMLLVMIKGIGCEEVFTGSHFLVNTDAGVVFLFDIKTQELIGIGRKAAPQPTEPEPPPLPFGGARPQMPAHIRAWLEEQGK